jgi:glycogen synthase
MTTPSANTSAPGAGRTRRLRLVLMTNSVAMGGMEEHVRLLARDVDRERFEVVGLAPRWDATERFAEQLAEACDRFDYSTPDRRHGPVACAREFVTLARRARRERFDVAHLHSTSYDGLMLAIVALRLGGVRRIVVTEHLAPESPVSAPARWRRAAVTRPVSALVCVSDNNREARARYLGAPAGRTFVVNNGIDVRRFDDPVDPDAAAELRASLSIAPDAPVVGTAIRFEPGKGVADLVDAFATVRREIPAAVLLMVGDGKLRDDLESRVARHGVADGVRFVGFQADPLPYIRMMDAFVLPVPFGSASIALLEAMAMSRACIITFGGDREAVQHGVSGFCARPNDPASIAEHVTTLLGDLALARQMGAAARRRVEADYSAARVARELEELYAHG